MKKNKLELLYLGYFLVISMLFGCTPNKQTKALKLNLQGEKMVNKESNDYFVGFFAESTDPIKLQIGHAFIGIGKGVPLTCNIDGTETQMFGFYPAVHTEGGKSFWAGPVNGKIKDDVRTDINKYAFKKITFADYIKVQFKMEAWKQKQYEVTRKDCISFFEDVAKTFDDIIVPDRTKFVTPEEYVSQFIAVNKLLN